METPNEPMYDVTVERTYDVTVTVSKAWKDEKGELACLADEELKQFLTKKRGTTVVPHEELPIKDEQLSDDF